MKQSQFNNLGRAMTCRVIILSMLLLFTGNCFAQEKTLLLKNVIIVDVIKGKLSKATTVIINGNRIAEIGKKEVVDQHATVIDAKGQHKQSKNTAMTM